MSTYVAVNTYTYSVTYVSEKILLSLKEIVRESGLDPGKLADEWEVLQRGISTWIRTRNLETVHLEVYDPVTDGLIGRWDFDIAYDEYGDDGMWVDTDLIRYHIRKQGKLPSQCDYQIVVHNKPGHPDVEGWSSCSMRSTDGFTRHAIGTNINGSNGLGARVAYWNN